MISSHWFKVDENVILRLICLYVSYLQAIGQADVVQVIGPAG
jgi:hypothetical protein